MILMSDDLRIGLLTGHIPVSHVAAAITPELIQQKVIAKVRVLNVDLDLPPLRHRFLTKTERILNRASLAKKEEKVKAELQVETAIHGGCGKKGEGDDDGESVLAHLEAWGCVGFTHELLSHPMSCCLRLSPTKQTHSR